MSDDAADVSARIVEAMRLGVVPLDDVRTYTVGRTDERELVADDLDRTSSRGGALRAFLGVYGTGKTHMLEIVRQLAIDRNFVVGEVVLDPEESAPSHPKRVYRRLVRSLRYPDGPSGGGLRPLLELAHRRPEVLASFLADTDRKPVREDLDRGAHLYLTPALRYWDRLTPSETTHWSGIALERSAPSDVASARQLLLDWLEGETATATDEIDATLRRAAGNAGKIYCMMDYRPWARIYGYLVSGLATLASRLGYAGLVVLFDEAEFYSLLSRENRAYARTLFKAYARASLPSSGANDLPFEADELDLGGYGVQQDLPTRFDASAHLYSVFAMTPHEEGLRALRSAVPDGHLTELQPLDERGYEELTRLVVEHYRRASDPDDPVYDAVIEPLTKLVDGLLAAGFLENPRAAMKFIVDFLDLARHEPDEIRGAIGELRERLTAT